MAKIYSHFSTFSRVKGEKDVGRKHLLVQIVKKVKTALKTIIAASQCEGYTDKDKYLHGV